MTQRQRGGEMRSRGCRCSKALQTAQNQLHIHPLASAPWPSADVYAACGIAGRAACWTARQGPSRLPHAAAGRPPRRLPDAYRTQWARRGGGRAKRRGARPGAAPPGLPQGLAFGVDEAQVEKNNNMSR